MTNEVFGTVRAILIITDTSLGAFGNQLGVLFCTFTAHDDDEEGRTKLGRRVGS